MAERLWTAAEMAAAVGGRPTRDFAATGVSIDSRTLQPGDLFIALRGEAHDGHDYLAQAAKAGAAAALVHAVPDYPPANLPLVIVPDTMLALQQLGMAARARSGARIAAITGSVGKTGSKEALRRALERSGATHASAGSYNNQFGVPLSLALMPESARFGVFELGMNHAGEIATLTRLVRPHLALVTNVEAVHLAFFPSVAAIADAKAEIFEGLERDGFAVLNRDNAYFERLAAAARRHGARVVGFGEAAGSDARLIRAHIEPDGSRVAADILGQSITYRVGLPGRHWVLNSLGVLAACVLLGGDLPSATEALAEATPLKGRGVRHRVALDEGDLVLIDDSYNASPPSMAAALSTLAAVPVGAGGRRIAVLGDMLELGSWAPELHRSLAAEIARNGVDLVFAAGPQMEHLWRALAVEQRGFYATNSAELAPRVIQAVRPGDAVLVKGSFGSRMNVVITALLACGVQQGAANG